ncbi:uncharacterized protein LOC108682994 isoform X2 [Hyalella azteca]|uniref:Uncharacterized protein LOC108682994 isoform X2 n=1 Tax=Hyalella azteca TaxID=294128 RepID=A0A8B7PP31_HYAAZ|nr:uncharacterized protein LOC108682994 isoform X2 [Hyalella azteca]
MLSFLYGLSNNAKLSTMAVLAGVSCSLYLLLKKWDSDWCCVTIEVPKEAAGRVIGRKGANIKIIEAKSQTSIQLKHTKTAVGKCQCTIRGSLDAVSFARSLLEHTIESASCNSIVQNMIVPSAVVGGILGTKGQNIKELIQHTGVHIKVEPKSSDPAQISREISIRGSKEGVAACVNVITDKVKHLLQRELTTTKNNRSKSTANKCVPSSRPDALQYSASEVRVCATASPITLYLQYVGNKSAELDDMIVAMSSYYSDPDTQTSMALTRACVGDMVAVRCSQDLWYRAQVLRAGERYLDKVASLVPAFNLTESKYYKVEAEISASSQNKVHCENSCENLHENQLVSHVPLNHHNDHNGADAVSEEISEENLFVMPPVHVSTCTANSISSKISFENKKALTRSTVPSQPSSQIPAENGNLPDIPGPNSVHKENSSGKPCLYLVFLVDYGDFLSRSLNDMCELRTDFLRLSHQAFKVQLADVAPIPSERAAAEFALSQLSQTSFPDVVTAKVVGYRHKNVQSLSNGHVNGSVTSKTNSVLPHKDPSLNEGCREQLQYTLEQLKPVLTKHGVPDAQNLLPCEVLDFVANDGLDYLQQTENAIVLMESELYYFEKLLNNYKIHSKNLTTNNGNDENCVSETSQNEIEEDNKILKILWKDITEAGSSANRWNNLDQFIWSDVRSMLQEEAILSNDTKLTEAETLKLKSDISSREKSLNELRWQDFLLRSVERLAFGMTNDNERYDEPVPLVRLCYKTGQKELDVADALLRKGKLRAC